MGDRWSSLRRLPVARLRQGFVVLIDELAVLGGHVAFSRAGELLFEGDAVELPVECSFQRRERLVNLVFKEVVGLLTFDALAGVVGAGPGVADAAEGGAGFGVASDVVAQPVEDVAGAGKLAAHPLVTRRRIASPSLSLTGIVGLLPRLLALLVLRVSLLLPTGLVAGFVHALEPAHEVPDVVERPGELFLFGDRKASCELTHAVLDPFQTGLNVFFDAVGLIEPASLERCLGFLHAAFQVLTTDLLDELASGVGELGVVGGASLAEVFGLPLE